MHVRLHVRVCVHVRQYVKYVCLCVVCKDTGIQVYKHTIHLREWNSTNFLPLHRFLLSYLHFMHITVSESLRFRT